jgi:RimJ/RimL family protein N-acetyltransferase
MELRDLTLDDLPLYEAIYCDPAMMEHLGGPRPREGLEDKLRRDVADVEAGRVWVLVIVPDPADAATVAGSVAVWEHDWDGRPIEEIGWMVLPAFQGRGLGPEAVRATLDRARATGRWRELHALPPVANERSNSMCRRMGFRLEGPVEYTYAGRWLLCNHWVLDLRADLRAG